MNLKLVYEYALRKPHTPAYLSEYAPRALDFYQSALAKDLAGNWYLQSQHLKTLRLPDVLGTPSPQAGVAGFHATPQGKYVHLTGTDPVIRLEGKGQYPYIEHANVLLGQWLPNGQQVTLAFTAHSDADIMLRQAKGCTFTTGTKRYPVQAVKDGFRLTLPAGDYQGQLHCE